MRFSSVRGPVLSVVLLTLAALFGFVHDAHAAQSYQYYKFTPVVRRGANPDYLIQFSELQVSLNGTRIAAQSVTNPGGRNPGNEGPPNLNDNSTSSKALDFNDSPTTGRLQFVYPQHGQPHTDYRVSLGDSQRLL